MLNRIVRPDPSQLKWPTWILRIVNTSPDQSMSQLVSAQMGYGSTDGPSFNGSPKREKINKKKRRGQTDTTLAYLLKTIKRRKERYFLGNQTKKLGEIQKL